MLTPGTLFRASLNAGKEFFGPLLGESVRSPHGERIEKQLFQNRRDLAQSLYNVLLVGLRLCQANKGTLTPDDLLAHQRPADPMSHPARFLC